MTASAHLDGRIDWGGTFAALVAAFPAPVFPNGTMAPTSDAGQAFWNVVAQQWICGAAQSTGNISYQVPLTGFTIVIAATGILTLHLDPAGTLATGTITMPLNPYDGMVMSIISSQAVTALTLSPAAGQTINGAASALVANTSIEYRYKLSNKKWYRQQ